MQFFKRERKTIQSNFVDTLKFYLAWGLTGALLIPMLGQLKVLVLYLALQLIKNDALRPPGWNSETMAGVDKCTTFVALGAWLILFLYAEGQIQEAQIKDQFWAQTGKMWLIIGGIYLAGALLLFVI